MKKIVIIVLSLLGFIGTVPAQQPTWYSFDQNYYKIPTAQDGIYRISYETMSQAGMNPSSINPANLQLFHRGKEVAIYVAGGGDGKMDPNDYIDFYGLRNDASLDSLLYQEIMVPNPYYNTFSDTTAFFLTVSPGQNGKRMKVRPTPSTSLPQANTYASERLQVFSDQYSLGISYALGFRLAKYDLAQGWMSPVVSKGATRQILFDQLGSLASSGEAVLEIGLVGRSANIHNTRILAGPTASSQREVFLHQFTSFNSARLSVPLLMSDFNSDGSISIGVNAAGTESADNIAIAYAKITYQKIIGTGDLQSETLILPSGNQQVRILGATGNYIAYDIADPSNPERVQLTSNSQGLSFLATDPNRISKVLLQSDQNLIPVNKMERLKFRDFLGQEANFILVGNRELEKPSSTFENPMKAYAEHRASAVGGGFDTLTFRMDELINHFGFGENSPLALFEFLRAYYPIHKPSHVLLAGRGLAIYTTVRSGGVNHYYRKNPSVFPFQEMVPVGGYPFSDNIYVQNLDPTLPDLPDIAIGRIPAKNSQELADYLGKAIEKDQLGISQPWQKELIHLGGGVSEAELDRFFNFLNGFKTIAEGPYLGGNVTTYRKRSNNVIEVIDITGDLNEGRSLVTFFGHGAPTILDIDIGFASDPTINYQNKGKYPVMLFNGCDYGSAFGTGYTQGEDWVMTPDKGASNILANSSIGVDVYLRRYSESFYSKAFADSSVIYRSIGEVKMEAERHFIRRYGYGELNYSHMEQMILFGDPALRMFPANKADYSVDANEVSLGSFDEDPISALSDSLKLTFALRNIGIVNTDSITYRVSRKLPDGTEINYDPIKIPYVARLDSIEFSVPNIGINSAGENTFTLEVNTERNVAEMTYSNNSISFSQFISLSGPLNLFPLEYGIVQNKNLELIAQIPGKALEDRTLIIQLDTAADFKSAYRKEVRLATRGLVNWPVELLSGNDTVTYYWRTRFQDVLPGETDSWTTSSFSFISDGPEGWIQRTIPQLNEDHLENIELDETGKTWKYIDKTLGIEVFTVGAGVDTLSFRNTQFYLNQVPQIIDNVNNANSRLCPDGSLGLVAFEQKSLQPYLAIPVPGFDILDGRSCGRPPQLIQSIRNSWITTPGQTMLQDYVANVPDGDYVVIFSVGNVTFDSWPDIAYQSLKEFGASEVTLRALKTGDPYILYGRKGMYPGEALEIVGNPNFELPSREQTLSFETDLEGYLTSGVIFTPRVGPASAWERFFQQVNDRPWIEEENTSFDIIGVKENGEEEVIFEGVSDTQLDLSFINPETYPYLRLRFSMEDPESTAPAFLDKWQVNYTGVPEGALTLKSPGGPIQLREGESTSVEFQFKNISKYDFLDSIQVNWTLTNVPAKKEENFSKKFPPLKAGEAFDFSIDFNSMGKAGANELEVFANPRIQREQTYRNNQMDLGEHLMVEGDNSTSLLDVNFDGVYIMDGDIVSPNVLITALLKNDQAFLYKQDTVGLELYLKQNCETCTFKRINFSDPNLTWSPAAENVDFKVSYLPGPLEDGMYTLRVQNEDSAHPYEVTFEVINEAQITNFYPYPNPFSSSVRFVFTLTGTDVPDEIKIQIMTVTGKVVREILQNELGPIRIGNNITEYAWDGRDEYGDQLANGVYIYRVLVRQNGQFMEQRPSAGDKAFKKGYGKMYLLR
ncbi:C25 family cysteine peptidase [Algoriphagus sp. CAU 1675]|nr:C25 family cysteine peptidase [Algoriphagus sp. CAU 1675]